MGGNNLQSAIGNPQLPRLAQLLLNWYSQNSRDLPWRRTGDPYAIWVSEIMLQQTQVKTVIPYWERWMRELPTIEAVAQASPGRIHKLWEGLGYYSRARNLQKAAQQIVDNCRKRREKPPAEIRSPKSTIRNKSEAPHAVSCEFPNTFEEVLALPGIGRYTAGAVCSIAFNQPTPILDGNVIRVLTRIFGIGENPREKKTNARLWQLAEELVVHASRVTPHAAGSRTRTKDEDDWGASHFNQSLMELGALVCTPRQPGCFSCPAQKRCVAFRDNRIKELPDLGPRTSVTARRFVAFVLGQDGRFFVRQRPAGAVNGHLWEFPNVEVAGAAAGSAFKSLFGTRPPVLQPLVTIKHSITRYRITLEAFRADLGGAGSASPRSKIRKSGTRGTRPSEIGVWLTPVQMDRLAFTSAHKKILAELMRPAACRCHKKLASAAADCIL